MHRFILATLIVGSSIAEEVPLSNDWNVPTFAKSEGDAVSMAPGKPSKAFASMRIEGDFTPGQLLRFSADVELENVRDDNEKDALKPFDLNLHPRNVCLTLAQLDAQGRPLCAPGSERLLGSTTQRLALETVVQQGTKEIELRLLCTFATGKAVFKNIRLERIEAPPLQPLAEARVETNPNGACYWTVNAETEAPAMYFGNNQFNRDDRILEEMEKAYGVGVRMFSFNLYLPSMVSQTETLRVVARFMERFPEAYFMPRVWLGPGRAWQDSFPEEMMQYANGQTGGYASASSEPWKAFTDFNLRELVRLIRRSPYAKQCIGFKLTYQQTGEWIFWDPQRAAGFDAPTRRAFGQTVPTEEERNTGHIGLFRAPKTQQREIDFSRFYNTAPADNIIRFAKTVKEASDGRSLVATFYGYLFELAWHEDWLQNGGHLGLEKLYRSPYIDIIGAPYSYNPIGRGFGLPVDLHGPFDGANAFGKMVMIEEDTFTHLAEDVPEVVKGYAPGYASRTHNMEETLAVLQRDLGVAIARNQILIWQNLFSEGRFNHQQIWDLYKPHLAWMKKRAETAPAYAPEVAVLADPAAVALLKSKAYGMTERWLYQPRFFLNRVDTTVGYFHTSELANLSDATRCIVLLTPWSLTDEQRQILETRFMRGGRMVVCCATTALGAIKLEKKNESILPESKLADGTLFGGQQFGMQPIQPVEPYFVVADQKVEVFAHYAKTGEPSCATRQMDGWTAVFLGSTGPPPATWRALFKKAGCRLYLADDDFSTNFALPDFLQANDDFLMIQPAKGGRKELRGKTINLEPGVPAFIYSE